jgi:hypothetical protein
MIVKAQILVGEGRHESSCRQFGARHRYTRCVHTWKSVYENTTTIWNTLNLQKKIKTQKIVNWFKKQCVWYYNLKKRDIPSWKLGGRSRRKGAMTAPQWGFSKLLHIPSASR